MFEQLNMFDAIQPSRNQSTALITPTEPAIDFRLIDDRDLAKNWRDRGADNITAIKLMQRINMERRPADSSEQSILAKFVGFGASELANSLFPMKGQPFRKGYEDIGADLHRLVGRAELAALARATQYAHYTPEYIVRALWKAVLGMGFTGGAVLEPGCGTGLFPALVPAEIDAACRFTGVERDPVTARIARLLHPSADIIEDDFLTVDLPSGFDLAIGNPPFSSMVVRGSGALGKLGLSLHDFFIAKSIDLLKPGGIAAFVVSRYTMDKETKTAREWIAGRADLIDAVRLPETSMRRDAGTDVVVDLLLFRRRAGDTPRRPWVDLAFVPTGAAVESGSRAGWSINEFFAGNREKVLGTHATVSSQFGPSYSVLPDGRDLSEAIGATLGMSQNAASDDAEKCDIAIDVLAPAPVESEKITEEVFSVLSVEPAPADLCKSDPEYTETIPKDATAPVVHVRYAPAIKVRSVADGGTIREGSYVVTKPEQSTLLTELYDMADRATGQARKMLLKEAAELSKEEIETLWQVRGGQLAEVQVKQGRGTQGMFASHAAIIRGLVPIRDNVRAVLQAQEADQPWQGAQAKLNATYDAFVAKFGAINKTVITVLRDEATGEESERVRRPNLEPMRDDPDLWLIASIEDWDEEAEIGRKGPIFTKRVVQPPAECQIVHASDALAVVLNECGKVDLARIVELMEKPVGEVLAELGDTIYRDPTTDEWQTSDAYLSGKVREKLVAAEKAAEADPIFARNVDALKAVQPVDLKPSEITARLGAPWIPVNVIEVFIEKLVSVKSRVHHTAGIASWTVGGNFRGNAAATSEWGTARRHAGELIEDALNARVPAIYDVEKDGEGREVRVLNTTDTEAAKDKLQKTKTAFQKWVWQHPGRADMLVKIYNDEFNNLVPREFDGSHLQLPGANLAISFRPHQKRGTWRIIASGSTYLAHAVGAGKTLEVIAAIMEQKRLGLITKPMVVVPGHTLAQWAREFLWLYPSARILVADEKNFAGDKRKAFLARAATGDWDAIIITHSAFKFIPTPRDFERGMIRELIESYEDMLLTVDKDDRISRKRLERMKEAMEEKLDSLKSRKDDLLTISQIGIDQICVDEAQDFRKLTFVTNMSSLKGITPDGSQRAWDLYVKSKFIGTKNPGRPLIMASGTPITNTMGELFSLLRFMAEAGLVERNIDQFDAWAAAFGDTKTELELQPSGTYRPVTRFCEFVNVPELVDQFRMIADVVLMEDLRGYMKLPRVQTGKRQIITAPASPNFKVFQKTLARRIKLIEQRSGRPVKGDDILLSVITDGRHGAIDLRMAGGLESKHNMVSQYDWVYENDPDNKLNLLVANAFRIWQETSANVYRREDGEPAETTGATQMIFCDLGTEAAEEKRGFSAYVWIRQELIRLGVPANQIAFMQHYKKASEKQRLFSEINAGRIRFLLGSSETMGTGVNAQQRLVALHHLDVPWIPSLIGQREGRIERQGNQNEEVGIYAYATLGSMDATMWQTNERKQRFIDAVMKGDRSIRRLEDMGDTADQFAMAKAIASGDERLMQKAGLEAELARLWRLRNAHLDDQHSVRREVSYAEQTIARADRRIPEIQKDIEIRRPTRGDAFEMEIEGTVTEERKVAGDRLASILGIMKKRRVEEQRQLAKLGGFDISVSGSRYGTAGYEIYLIIDRTNQPERVDLEKDLTPIGLLMRLEHRLEAFEAELGNHKAWRVDAERRLSEYAGRADLPFELQAELDAKEAELAELDADLAAAREE